MMALGSLSTRALTAGLRSNLASRQLIASSRFIRASPLTQMRYQTTAVVDAPKSTEPKAVAESLISVFPGESLAAKSSSVLVAASIAAFLISKEVYIIDAEALEMLCIFGAYYVWYSNGKEGALAYFQGRKDAIRNVLTQARLDHKAVVQERITHIGKLSDAVEVTKGLFDISKEIAKLEAEAYELKQKTAFGTEVKSVLDSWVRHETNVREEEQKRLTAHVIGKIQKDLTDPKLQQAILQQSIADIEKLAASTSR